ncbi:putative katanin p60 ATPase-containing subunit A1-like [Capsicum annuum]|uniref:RING-type E3 ubiquitin transferase n=2 Tax=Capsicum annuum TaxID=4072 RepID=A0A2G3A3C7_CAPAN|nr:uncharacterized protein LOC107861894 isoform X1 [Capsicum annuum]KAF3673899.1 putative katanin p60 ATPase-containing subunit A1-like [Capsicum annuum]PHT88738.1 hypothetical protein T459_10844 [Capsicum annuum]
MSFFASDWTMTGIIIWLMLLCVGFVHSYMADELGPRTRTSMTYKYERTDEVKKECAFVLASASELKPGDNRMDGLKYELSFLNGDWWQVSNGVSIMPFDDRDLVNRSLDLRSPLSLVSFWVTDVDRSHRDKKSMRVSGIMQIGITLDGLFSSQPYERSPRFDIWPGHSQLSVTFEGIYIESKSSREERVMCLLGTTMLPSRQQESTDPWEWVMESGYTNQPPLMQDDRILLVLHYPRTNTLTNRAILGTMKSLNPKTSFKYFDEVHMSSWAGTPSKYEFGSEKFVSKACDPYPYKDSLSTDINTYRGPNFCYILQRFTLQEAFTVVPNWKCNGTDDFCSQLGPFSSDKDIKATDGGFKDVKLVLWDVRCDKISVKDNVTSSRVSSVFRVVSPSENQFTAAQRTGLNNMTLSAEGIWKSSSGQLCMVGCRGVVGAEDSNCDSRICLYVPLSFSITQRSIIIGHFSSINGSSRHYFPLSFEKLIRPVELWDHYTDSRPYYKYSKIDAAATVLEKNEAFSFGSMFKKSMLTFPKLEDADSFPISLSILSEDLSLHTSAVADQLAGSANQRVEIEMEILSLGPMFGPLSNGSISEKENSYHAKAEYTEKQLLLNVSAQLSLTGTPYSNMSSLFVEGLYDPHVGKMYLIGCRDVRTSWKILSESMDLEAGLDCLIEVVMAYPPTTARWLVNPTSKISISSQRNEDDPLYFNPVNIQTFPIMYRKQRENILSRRAVEGILRILTLSLAIFCIFSQLFYIRDNAESVPYVSLAMLGVQALGFSLPLITGAEALFKMMGAEINETPSDDLDSSQWIRVIDYTVKVLVLVSFLAIARLSQKVWRSRIRLLTRSPLEPHRVPSDKWVLLSTLVIHAVGYIIVLFVHSFNTSQKPLHAERYVDSTGNFHTLREWETELEAYMGLIQDFFLLPQVIGNLVWQIQCKPLRKLYYIGLTSVRLLPHVYDYIRSPVPNPYFSEEYEFVNPRFDFYTKFGDVAIPVAAVVLAVVVYIQQRWNYEKLSQTLRLGKIKLLPVASRVYERLPSAEAELTLGANDHDKDRDVD